MIGYDPTEARDNTRLPQTIIDAGNPVVNLEEHTGADLLISPLALPLKEINASLPCQSIFKRHLAKGMLIQRKHGRDFLGSIEHLADIERRMLETGCKINYLLVIGEFSADKEGQCLLYVDGRRQETGWTYASVLGAMEMWKMRGGYLTILPHENLIASWLNGWLERLKKLDQEPLLKVIRRYPRQMLSGPDWTDTLATIPGIGPDRAKRISAYAGTLSDSLCYLTQPETEKLEGIGPKTFERAREYLGLKDGYLLQVMAEEKETETE